MNCNGKKKKYWLTSKSKPVQEKWFRLIDRPDMTIVVEWDVKLQNTHLISLSELQLVGLTIYILNICFDNIYIK